MSYVTYHHSLHLLVRDALNLAEKNDKGLWIYPAKSGEWFELYNSRLRGVKAILYVPKFCLFSKHLSSTERAIINKAMRVIDDSNSWPINGKFNATERAIRRLLKWERGGGEFDCAYSYWQALENEVSSIVNGEV